MMKKFYTITLAATLLLSACGTQTPQNPKKQEAQKTKATTVKKASKSIQQSTMPKWIANPDTDGHTGAVGVVKLMKNKKKQNYIAKKLAIAELQERKRVMMSSKVDTKEVVKNGKVVNSELTQTTKQTSSHFNSDVIVQKAEYSDGKNYYVWMVIE